MTCAYHLSPSYSLTLKRGPVVSFGIGGQLVLSFAPSLYGSSGFFAKGAGPVEIVSLGKALKSSDFETSLCMDSSFFQYLYFIY